MSKEFTFDESKNMVYAVSGSYISRKEVLEYFNTNFDEDKMFTPDELKQIVRTLTTGRERITKKIDEINIWNTKTKRWNREYNEEEER